VQGMIVYSKTICPKCLWIKSELEQKELEYQEINIDKNTEARQKIIEAGILSVPVVEINGELISDMPKIMAQIAAMTQ
jgi:glutaredoxin